MISGEYILVKAPDDYIGKRYRNKYCLEHHLVYFQHYGVVPQKGEVIHHINGNKRDNRIENLRLLSIDEHNKIHKKKELIKLVKLKCPNCGKEFIVEKRHSILIRHYKSQCCSRDCAYKLDVIRRIDNDEYLQLIKDNVIEEFMGSKEMVS